MAWLIEKNDPAASQPSYYGLTAEHELAPATEVWTTKPEEAVDFPTRGDAQRFVVFALKMQGKVVEVQCG